MSNNKRITPFTTNDAEIADVLRDLICKQIDSAMFIPYEINKEESFFNCILSNCRWLLIRNEELIDEIITRLLEFDSAIDIKIYRNSEDPKDDSLLVGYGDIVIKDNKLGMALFAIYTIVRRRLLKTEPSN